MKFFLVFFRFFKNVVFRRNNSNLLGRWTRRRRASPSAGKNTVELLCSINTTGEEGEGAATDMVNEWAVGDTKPL
jgi:hypothetical protein